MKARLLQLWSRLSTSYWFVPGLITVAAAALAVALVRGDAAAQARGIAGLDRFELTGPEGARALLSTIAASAITVAALVFSITMVVLNTAAAQCSRPRAGSDIPGGLAVVNPRRLAMPSARGHPHPSVPELPRAHRSHQGKLRRGGSVGGFRWRPGKRRAGGSGGFGGGVGGPGGSGGAPGPGLGGLRGGFGDLRGEPPGAFFGRAPVARGPAASIGSVTSAPSNRTASAAATAHVREEIQQHDREQLDRHERHHTAEDLVQRDVRRRHALQVEHRHDGVGAVNHRVEHATPMPRCVEEHRQYKTVNHD
jgi:hypothetical protein